ncbi:unnamed protein product [Polarella glacialis]|uniref:Uncharacterized protein n=1 Tax=Polarella glacialis TaxID=89957 RepID=A0A813KZX6_POLGL|nr:unnamed protein product [Polarella glacialis]
MVTEGCQRRSRLAAAASAAHEPGPFPVPPGQGAGIKDLEALKARLDGSGGGLKQGNPDGGVKAPLGSNAVAAFMEQVTAPLLLLLSSSSLLLLVSAAAAFSR